MENTFQKCQATSPQDLSKLLHPDLRRSAYEEGGILSVNMPFYIGFIDDADAAGRANGLYSFKREQTAASFEAGDWESYLFSHTRPYRLQAFSKVADRLRDAEYWELLGDIWVDTENLWQDRQDWLRFLTSRRSGRRSFMEADERVEFDALPSVLPVYRAYRQGLNYYGPSWTLNRDYAERLAQHSAPGSVRQRAILKSDVFAYLTRREESEIVLLSELEKAVNAE